MSNPWSIETNDLCRRFGRREAVAHLNVRVPAGSIFAFLGRNGAGKTTTIRLLAGLLEPTHGNASVLGRDSRRLKPADWERIGYVAENQKLYDWMTGEELLNFTRPFYPDWDTGLEAELVKDLSLHRRLGQRISHLSRGERAKLALLLALPFRPKLLLLDEPFGGLDPLARDEFLQSLIDLASRNEWTIFFSTHAIEDVERLADHVAILDEGRLRLSGAIEEVMRRHRRVRLFARNGELRPPSPPGGVLDWRLEGNEAEFIDRNWGEGREAELRGRYADLEMDVAPLTLREIFIHVARHFRERSET